MLKVSYQTEFIAKIRNLRFNISFLGILITILERESN